MGDAMGGQVVAQVRAWRRQLKVSDGIYVYKELHATEFVAGRGRIAPRPVTKFRRSQVFCETLDLVTTLPGAHNWQNAAAAYAVVTFFCVSSERCARIRLLD